MKYLVTALSLFLAWSAAADRLVPELPGPGERIRVIIDTDAACEIDDLYALALALTARDKLHIEGFVGAHFGDSGGPDGIGRSVETIHTMLEKAGLSGQFPVKRGAHPLRYGKEPSESEGVDFIIEKALASSAEDPLWVILLGPLTDIASAQLKEPKITDRVRVFWHGRTQWPERCWNFTAYNDTRAVRTVFSSNLPLVLFDTGTYLRCTMEESEEKLRPLGPLGEYLHDFRLKKPWFQVPTKGFFDLGDIAALVDPTLTYHETTAVPSVNWDLRYDHRKTNGKMLRIYQIDRDRTFDMLYKRLKTHLEE